MFQVRNVNGSTPFPEDRGWKDTVWIDGQVEAAGVLHAAVVVAFPVPVP
nr:cell division protein [Raoultella sp. NCTC 9187]